MEGYQDARGTGEWGKVNRNGFVSFELEISKDLELSWTAFIYLLLVFKESGVKGKEAADRIVG